MLTQSNFFAESASALCQFYEKENTFLMNFLEMDFFVKPKHYWCFPYSLALMLQSEIYFWFLVIPVFLLMFYEVIKLSSYVKQQQIQSPTFVLSIFQIINLSHKSESKAVQFYLSRVSTLKYNFSTFAQFFNLNRLFSLPLLPVLCQLWSLFTTTKSQHSYHHLSTSFYLQLFIINIQQNQSKYNFYYIRVIFEIQLMNQKADHPHQAVVHLMKSLRCCKNCYDVSEVEYAEIGQLQFQKDALTRQLNQLGSPQVDLQRISGQVKDLQFLVRKVKQQNEVAYQAGLKQVQQVVLERQNFQKQQNEAYFLQLNAEKERYNALTLQIQSQMQRIRYLHRINQQLVNRFCQY